MADSPIVERLADLARLRLAGSGRKRRAEEFQAIVDFVNQVAEIDVERTPLTTTISGVQHVLREDEVRPSVLADALLAQAPVTDKRWVRSPAVL